MITAQEIARITFEKTMRGYRTDDVDQLLDRVAEQLDADATKITALQSENEAMKHQLYTLAQKVEEYLADENNLKSALINAQRMGESVIREADQKAEVILREAGMRANDITRHAREELAEEKIELERIKVEVADFKANVLNLYRQHIESLSTLPGREEEPEAEEVEVSLDENFAAEELNEVAIDNEPAAVPVSAPEEAAPTTKEDDFFSMAMNHPAEPVEVAKPVETVEACVAPVAATATVDFWEKDESSLKTDVAKETAPPDMEATVLEAFKGIQFSD